MALTRPTLTRRQIRALVAVAVALAALTGAFVWFAGSEDRALEGACDGVLPIGEVRAVLGDDAELDVTNRTEGSFGKTAAKSGEGDENGTERANSLSAHCRITAEDTGHIAVSIAGSPRPRAEYGYDDLYAAVPARRTLPVPLGHGWSGLFATDTARLDDAEDGTATTAVLLDCARRGESLLITVETALRGRTTLDDPAVRPDFVRTATATAEAANDHWGCGARLGKPVRTVGLPVNEDEYEPLLGAKGTCAAVPTASRSAVSTARETARDRAPREACVLGTRDGSPLYRLEAYYGPYAEDARSQYTRDYDYENVTPAEKPAGRLGRSAYWAGATCPRGAESALYLIRADAADGETRRRPDLAYERAALAAFAAASAEHHGCAAPTLPEGG
ncbi:hypothetical protein [Streptomyces iranensis]|uniref:Aromatic ring-opening dioxygenase LigA n=1 Tax=Streptomyces iranensis TaxID=576784 RepID=A0A060ZL16_9ACTN|nr:hypothetical protein [Streptomyces iranensis]MBP2060972.1 hypothetical protein [Streptomyces iranensis]CDR06444.1 predicted protein [Streptomyces iranensis]